VTGEARALSALAEVWNALGDPGQALALAGQALTLRERLPAPAERAASHNNLANYLHTKGFPDDARAHQLAALAYIVVTGLDPRIYLRNLALRSREAAARGERFALPRLALLLATPAFAALRTFLQERDTDLSGLEARIDGLVEQAGA
jgi:hypothetical protein